MARYIDAEVGNDKRDKLMITVQWHPTKLVAVAQQWLSAQIWDELWGDDLFEVERWADLDRELLRLCDEVRADRYSWVGLVDPMDYPMDPAPDSGLHRQFKDGIPYLGGPKGGDFEDVHESWIMPGKRIRVPLPQHITAAMVEYDNLAVSPLSVMFETATYECTRVYDRRVLSYVPEDVRVN